jgi:hypothetical protein
VATGSGNLEWLGAFRLSVYVDLLTWLYAERRAVYALSVYEDVAVHNHLTSLCDGAGEACTKHEGVEAHLQKLNQVLTGQAIGTLCLSEGLAELCLADTVLGAKTLLLAQTDGEVAVSLLAGAAVLTRSVWTLL